MESLVSEERRAEIERKIRQRVALEKKAFDFVTHLALTDSVSEEELLEIGQHITRDNYSDVTEERSIEKLCGYPLCSNPLENIIKQKYKISLKNKAVYDLTDRKKFCSNRCYEASKHFQKQISETPVWARDTEDPVKFTVLPSDEERTVFPRGRNGDIVFENPQSQLSEDLKALRLDDNAQEKSITSPDISSGKHPTVQENIQPSGANETTAELTAEEPKNLAQEEIEESTVTVHADQQKVTLAEKLKFMREWRTSQTIDFFNPAARREPSDSEEKFSQSHDGNQEENDDVNIRLVAVDHHSQHTQRKKIVVERLNHVWPKLESMLGVNLNSYSEEIKSLISTFEFTSKNILFNPAEWLLVGYILLKMLDEGGSKRLFSDKSTKLNLKPFSVNEEEIADVVDYMTSSGDMDAVD